jgi:LacI family transcriptional regulator
MYTWSRDTFQVDPRLTRRRTTSLDVARLAGVSRATVSYVLNDSDSGIAISQPTRTRVLEAARQLGYYPNAAARSLRGQRTGVVGLAPHESAYRMTSNAFLPLVIGGITSVFGPADVKLLIEPFDPSQTDPYISLVRGGRVDGIIFAGQRADDEQVRQLYADRVPVVLWGGLPGSDLPYVDIDNVAAARRAVEHLLSLGHRRIACITDGPAGHKYPEVHDRLDGYRTALESHGIPFDESLLRHGDFDEQSGDTAMRSLLAAPERPSAVFVASDEVAFGAMKAAKALGARIPHDLALVGFDDLPTAAFVEPPLTTVRVPAREIGAAAARMLLQILETGHRADSVILDTELVVRESSGARLPQQPQQ